MSSRSSLFAPEADFIARLLNSFTNAEIFSKIQRSSSEGLYEFVSALDPDVFADREKLALSVFLNSPMTRINLDIFLKFPDHLKVAALHELQKSFHLGVEMCQHWPEIGSIVPKNVSKFLEYRDIGNSIFRERKYAEALKWYSKCVAVAPKNSEELALAFANRSAALFRLKKYRSALLDINRALEGNNYPDRLKPKLHSRKRSCVSQITRCSTNARGLRGALEKLTLDEMKTQFDENATDVEFVDQHPLPATNFQNKLLPNTSHKVMMKVEKASGHLIAAQNIKPGEILLFEKPFASILRREFSKTHCSFCYSRNEALIPCDGCSLVMFCGQRCRDAALELFHRIECEYMEDAFGILDDTDFLNARMLLIASQQGKTLSNILELPNAKNPYMDDPLNLNSGFTSDYLSVCSSESIPMTDFKAFPFVFAMGAGNCLHFLKHTSFLKNLDDAHYNEKVFGDVTEAEARIGTLLMKQLQLLLTNNHSIREGIETKGYYPSREGYWKAHLAEFIIGRGFYPLLTRIKHSCDPNVAAISYGNTLVMYAVQPIAAGELLLQSRGCNYITQPLAVRRRTLSVLCTMKCECSACKYDWPLYPELHLRYPKPQFKSKENISLKKMQHDSKKMYDILMRTLKPTNADFEFVCGYLCFLCQNVEKPWKEFADCGMFIQRMLAQRGNFYNNDDYFLLAGEEIEALPAYW